MIELLIQIIHLSASLIVKVMVTPLDMVWAYNHTFELVPIKEFGYNFKSRKKSMKRTLVFFEIRRYFSKIAGSSANTTVNLLRTADAPLL